MVYRIYVEKRPELALEAEALAADIRNLLGIRRLTGLRIWNRYDVEGIEADLFMQCRAAVFAEAQTDLIHDELPIAENIFAVEYLPGQYDQRADAAAQCIALLSQKEAPTVRTARVYLPEGPFDEAELAAIKRYVINPVEAREASLAPCDSLAPQIGEPVPVPVLEGFIRLNDDGLAALIEEYALAMQIDDLKCCRAHFLAERRDPTLTELRLLDTYWSDHCRHTTFLTELDALEFHDERAQKTYADYLALRREIGDEKPVTLMNMATAAARWMKAKGKLEKLDDSAEINACTVRVEINADGKRQPWLLLFKNETHNHPTEIEPFGGAATCIGGAIRDPLSGRAFVYQAMRLTGAADPRRPFSQTLPGKLPQRAITTKAAAGYSSYGNQIGLATGLVDEVYHDGFLAKRMEIGAVLGAAPTQNVRRETPEPGDVVLLLGGRTGRDGCGGATGSSRAHHADSLSICGAQVQKGNAPEERKLQRLFRNPEAARLIRRCNDFGAGGVSVAIGELADGVFIDLDRIPVKYEGLDGTELAISESQERMAVVVAPENVETFLSLARAENLLATPVATISREPRLTMTWRGERIADLPRAFIDSNGAARHARAVVETPRKLVGTRAKEGFCGGMRSLVADLNICSKRGLAERFDATVGAHTVLMPYGGARQLTPAQVMAAKLPLLDGETSACTVMAWGYDPYLAEASPYSGAYAAVVHSVAKLVAAGAPLGDCYLSFQEYFGKPGNDPLRWGKPAAALLGALEAQLGLGIAAIGGKDSMSGSFEALDVPPTLVSFAVALADAREIVSPECKRAGSKVVLLRPERRADGLPEARSLNALFARIRALVLEKKVSALYAAGSGGVAEAVFKMCLGNGFGFRFEKDLPEDELFEPLCGAFVAELSGDCDIGTPLGHTSEERAFCRGGERMDMDELEAAWEGVLEDVFPTRAKTPVKPVESPVFRAGVRIGPREASAAKPRVLIPVFPGTNCEYESARAVARAGAVPDVLVINTLTPAATQDSLRAFAARLDNAQILFLPGGFSSGDEPDGSGKFIAAFLRNPRAADALSRLLDARDGLVVGICNGFQALVKLGLVPYGRISEPAASSPTLTFNEIGRHQSRLVRIRVASDLSPWLMRADAEAIYTVPISHGEGRFICTDEAFAALAHNGQIAAQYVDELGRPSMDIRHNPAGSAWSVEAITSPDGRVLGKMGHSERIGAGLYQNVPGLYDMRLFESAADYFR